MVFWGWDCWKRARASPRRATSPRIEPRRAYSAASASSMPLDAPVIKTFNGELIPALVKLHLLGANLRDQVIEHLDRARQAVGLCRARFVLALHGERRHAVDTEVFD